MTAQSDLKGCHRLHCLSCRRIQLGPCVFITLVTLHPVIRLSLLKTFHRDMHQIGFFYISITNYYYNAKDSSLNMLSVSDVSTWQQQVEQNNSELE